MCNLVDLKSLCCDLSQVGFCSNIIIGPGTTFLLTNQFWVRESEYRLKHQFQTFLFSMFRPYKAILQSKKEKEITWFSPEKLFISKFILSISHKTKPLN